MPKHIFATLALIFAFTFTPCMLTSLQARVELSEIDNQQIKIELVGKNLYVTGAMGKTLHIYNLVGMEIMSIKVDSQEKKIDLSDLKKVVLVKVGNISKRIILLSR